MKETEDKRLLLHTCCAPCLLYPIQQLKDAGFKVSGFFYNPNIYPAVEYQNRRKALSEVAASDALDVLYPDYVPLEFFHATQLYKEKPLRCSLCWDLRLRRTAQEAKDRGYAYFSTTLLVSPYQDQEALKIIGNNIERETGAHFYYEDFRPGFRQAHNEARARGIYCQKYCGCMYSQVEQCRR